jgi:flagellin-like hook-associated protein FlgL
LTATDTEIDDALSNLETAQSTLSAKRQGLGADAAGITRYEAGGAQTSSFYQALAESLTNADPATAAVELQSVDLQRSLAMETLSGISTMRSAVLELLR